MTKKVVTNGHWRPILSWFDLSEKEQFSILDLNDHLSFSKIESMSFFRYCKEIYSLGNFLTLDNMWYESIDDWHDIAVLYFGKTASVSDNPQPYIVFYYLAQHVQLSCRYKQLKNHPRLLMRLFSTNKKGHPLYL